MAALQEQLRRREAQLPADEAETARLEHRFAQQTAERNELLQQRKAEADEPPVPSSRGVVE